MSLYGFAPVVLDGEQNQLKQLGFYWGITKGKGNNLGVSGLTYRKTPSTWLQTNTPRCPVMHNQSHANMHLSIHPNSALTDTQEPSALTHAQAEDETFSFLMLDNHRVLECWGHMVE